MATTFQVKRSSVAGKVPNTSTLSIGELGLNLTDQIIYSSNGTGVFELGANVTNQTIKTSLLIGNSSVNTTVNSTSVAIGANNLTVGTSLYAVSNGNVGIGTSSPTNELQVTGIIKATSRLYVGSTSDDLYSGGIINLSNSTRSIGINVDPTNSGTNSILNFSIDGSEFMRLTSTGRLGIGTTGPSGKLHIVDTNAGYLFTSNSTSNYTTTINMDDTGLDIGHNSASRSINFLTNSLDRMTITGAGNVGIGSSSPKASLHISGSAILQQAYQTYLVNAYYDGDWKYIENGMAWGIGNNFGGPTNGICIATATVNSSGNDAALTWLPRLNIDSSGNVGIGTSSPSYKLHVVESSGIAIYGSSSTNHGVYGISSSQYGVVGISNSAIGVFGQSSSSQGVYGSSSTGTGIYGLSTSNYGAYSQSTNNYGIFGRTLNSGFGGIIGYNHDASKYAILGFSTNYAVYGAGDAYFSGALSKGSGSFNIAHPLPELSETHRLVHSFVEAPTADNIYRGRLQLANGQATVNIDTHVGMTEGTFSALNGNIQVFLQNESGWDLVRGSVTDNILSIISQNQSSTDTISWMVIGERQDQHMLDTQWTDEFGRPILEPLKEPEPEIPSPPEPEVPNENG